MNPHYDVIVIGAGHNGLVTAAYLAQSGQSVLVLEQRSVPGGAAATEESFPGYQINTGAHDAGLFPDEIVQKLFLKMSGLAFRQGPAAVFAPQPAGDALTLWHDVGKTKAEIARFSRRDSQRFPDFKRQVERMAQILQHMMFLTPPDLAARDANELLEWGKVGLKLKRLGNKEMMEFMRILPLPASEYLDEWFESDALKGALGADGITGTRQGPRSAGTALMLLYRHTQGFLNTRFVGRGMGQLAAALATAAQQNGAEIRTETAVSSVRLEDGKATGVILADGKEISARVVVSNADPRRTFFGLVGAPHLEPRFMRQVRSIIYRGSTAKVNLALAGLPRFTGQTAASELSGHIRISPSLDYLERAYDDAKYSRVSTNPYLDITLPTLHDPYLAPDGRHILSITMQYAPYALRDGDWHQEREALGDHIIDTLAQYAPGLKDLILHRQVLTPLDWEQTYGLSEGSIYHGQMGLDQLLMMRPVPGWGQYRTPIDNLYLCGAGTHPGGGVTGVPGYNAAREILRALQADA